MTMTDRPYMFSKVNRSCGLPTNPQISLAALDYEVVGKTKKHSHPVDLVANCSYHSVALRSACSRPHAVQGCDEIKKQFPRAAPLTLLPGQLLSQLATQGFPFFLAMCTLTKINRHRGLLECGKKAPVSPGNRRQGEAATGPNKT